MRWKLKLEEYDYKIHKAGKDNTNADALSQNAIRNDKHVHNVQSKEWEDDNKEDKEVTTKEYTETINPIWILWLIRKRGKASKGIANKR